MGGQRRRHHYAPIPSSICPLPLSLSTLLCDKCVILLMLLAYVSTVFHEPCHFPACTPKLLGLHSDSLYRAALDLSPPQLLQ